MPMLTMQVVAEASGDLSRRIAETLTDATARILGKDPAVTAVAIAYVAPEHWFAGRRSLSEQGRAAYWLDIKITDATNTKAEMAAYIAEIHRAMAALLGPLHEESYVLVHPVPAAAYGYGGLTQEQRFIEGRLQARAQAA